MKESLFELHRPAAMQMAMRLTGNRDNAEDLVQEAFCGIWRTISNSPVPITQLPANYISRCIRNEYIQAYRRDRCRIKGEPFTGHEDNEPVDPAISVEVILLKRCLAEEVIEQVYQLNNTDRVALLHAGNLLSPDLRDNYLKTVLEGTRKSRLNRARQNLQAKWNQYEVAS